MHISYPPSDVIHGIRYLSEPLLYPKSHGDVWSCTWAEDDLLYSVADDTHGVADACDSNLAMHVLKGCPPSHCLETINPMSDYGSLQFHDGFDSWKANGLVSVDGVLYLGVSQHSSAYAYADNIQRTYDARIIKSADHGLTWSDKASLGEGTFPTLRFASPFFVQFGQDYQDAMDDYVYAVSSSAVWNNGNYMTMARVPRRLIGDLNREDWEFIQEIDERNEPVWTHDYTARHKAIFAHRGFTSMTGIQYVPAVDRFVLGQWAYIDQDGPHPWRHTMLALYEAPRPWGPWKCFHVEPDWGYAYYNPSLPAKWFTDGGRRMWMTMAGNFSQEPDAPFSYGFIAREFELVL